MSISEYQRDLTTAKDNYAQAHKLANISQEERGEYAQIIDQMRQDMVAMMGTLLRLVEGGDPMRPYHHSAYRESATAEALADGHQALLRAKGFSSDPAETALDRAIDLGQRLTGEDAPQPRAASIDESLQKARELLSETSLSLFALRNLVSVDADDYKHAAQVSGDILQTITPLQTE